MISSNSAYGNTAYSSISSLNSPEEMFNKTAGTDGSVNIGVKKSSSSSESQASLSLKQTIEDAINANQTNPSQNTKQVEDKEKDKEVEQSYYHRNNNDIASSFDILAAEIGAVGGRITKEQLAAYYQSLMTNFTSGQDNTQAIIFVKNLLAKFDTLSDGQNYITSLEGINEPQDYKTVTKEQVTPPIDLKI